MKPQHFFLTLVLLAPLLAMPAAAVAQSEPAVGSIARLVGQADVVRNDEPPAPIAESDDVFRSDELMTRADSLIEVALNDGSRFTLDENSRVAIAEYVTGSAPQSLLELARGRLRSSVSNTFSDQRDAYRVQTREGVMGVQGTEFDVLAIPRETVVYVYEGVVSATSRDPAYPESRILRAGDFVRIRLGEPIPRPSRFVGTDAADDAIGSGSGPALIAGGDQGEDPTVTVPETPDQINDDGVRVPPDPNPPTEKKR